MKSILIGAKLQILVVEDEPEMLHMLCDGLKEHGHVVARAANGECGLSLAVAGKFDVIILDVVLPGLDGYEMATALRNSAGALSRLTPILMLTACDREDQIIRGLDIGADYYVTKPFSFLELLARIKATQRHTLMQEVSCVHVDDLVLDPDHHQIRRAGTVLDLSMTEWRLLAHLIRSAGATVTRRDLMAEVWGKERKVGNSTLDAFINLLRNKVDLPFKTRLIQTVRGVGYSIRSAKSDSYSDEITARQRHT